MLEVETIELMAKEDGDIETMKAIEKNCRIIAKSYKFKYGGACDYLMSIIASECSKALVVEAADARTKDNDFDVNNFLEKWLQDGLLRKYSVGLNRRIRSVTATLSKIEDVASEVANNRFTDKDLVDLEFLGDLHERSIAACLKFSDGNKVFLKLNGASNFQFAHNVRLRLMSMSGVDKDNFFHLPKFEAYGEHLLTFDVWRANEDEDPVDLVQWYRQVGTLLAFSALIGLTDLHFENIITAAGKLYLIDLDTIFHPRVQQPDYPNRAYQLVEQKIYNSVLGIGLLPFGTSKKADDDTDEVINFAGLTATKKYLAGNILVREKSSPQRQLWKIKPTKIKEIRSDNIPVGIHDGRQSLYKYGEVVVESFRAIIGPVMENLTIFKEYLAAESEHVVTRFLVRNTSAYSTILNLASSPLLTSRVRAVDALWRNSKGLDPQIVAEEVEQIENGHIPVFWCRCNETLYGMKYSPFLRHCVLLTRDWLNHQTEILEFFLKEKKALTVGGASFSEILPTIKTQTRPLEVLLKDLLEHLLKSAYHADDGTVSYTSLTVDSFDELMAMPMGDEVYGGLTGALFAARALRRINAGWVPGEFIEALENSAACFPASPKTLGYFNAGVKQIMQIVADPNRACDVPQADVGDFIGGLPGIISFLLSCNGHCAEVDAAVDRLVRSLKTGNDDTLYWRKENERVYASFAHGISGIIYALSRYHRFAVDKNEIVSVIDKLLRHEFRSLPHDAVGIYFDSRSNDGASANWCHSISGMLITRVELLDNKDLIDSLPASTTDRIRQEAHNQIVWLDSHWGDTLSYGNCHGVAGNLAILKWASTRLSAPTETQVRDEFERLLTWGMNTNWGDTTSDVVCNSSLMNGLWGVAYSAAYACCSDLDSAPFWAVADNV